MPEKLPEPKSKRFEPSAPTGSSVTIVNDVSHDALILLLNEIWGAVSIGYARVGKRVSLPTDVNVDVYVLFEYEEDVFISWPGPGWKYNRCKINATPGDTISISNMSTQC